MLSELQLRNFRCFESLALEFSPGFNFFLGQNGQGKTSVLEAACALLRLQSQRSVTLSPAIRAAQKSFTLAGKVDGHLHQFYYSQLRRKIAFDGAVQRELSEYLQLARVVSFANADIELARGGSESRRRYLDFVGAQIEPRYRPALRGYERALRSRNALLKSPVARPRELAAYTEPLLEFGRLLSEMRGGLVERLAPIAEQSHRAISGRDEILLVRYAPGNGDDFAAELERSRAEEERLRQTVIGPHRDDIALEVQGMPAAQFASEGQQRTIVLALKLAQASVFTDGATAPPLLLLDDIFGELDPQRRNALLAHLPASSQKFVTATALDWMDSAIDAPIYELRDGGVHRR